MVAFNERPIAALKQKVGGEIVGGTQVAHERALLASEQNGARGTASLVRHLEQSIEADFGRFVFYDLGMLVLTYAAHEHSQIRRV